MGICGIGALLLQAAAEVLATPEMVACRAVAWLLLISTLAIAAEAAGMAVIARTALLANKRMDA
jgi:hypothetical protein